ncbi:MAG: GyrI-like domain-containing protein [Chloroflexi bacterium]|nr:GyrI-like domain-containing protein [Chloroflexota bacterium]MCC6893066.1 hypothetical protein [Anaerolineae bacterium]
MTTVGEAKIDIRPERPYLGIRAETPFKGMFSVADQLIKELRLWFKEHEIEPAGPAFLRYHIINMEGIMHIGVGIPVATPQTGDGRVYPDMLPAGRYGSLIFVGHGLTGNKALGRWAGENNIAWDRRDDPRGDVFSARTETYLTDPKVQPLKTKWEVEVAIKIKDEA